MRYAAALNDRPFNPFKIRRYARTKKKKKPPALRKSRSKRPKPRIHATLNFYFYTYKQRRCGGGQEEKKKPTRRYVYRCVYLYTFIHTDELGSWLGRKKKGAHEGERKKEKAEGGTWIDPFRGRERTRVDGIPDQTL